MFINIIKINNVYFILTDRGSSSSILLFASILVMYMMVPFSEPPCTTNFTVSLSSFVTSPAKGATIYNCLYNDSISSFKMM